MVCFQRREKSEGQSEGAETSVNRSAAQHRSYAVDYTRGAAGLGLGLAAYPRFPRVSSVEEVVEAVQARAGTLSKFARPVAEAGTVLATGVQRQGRTLQAGGRQARRLLWLIGEMKVSSTRAI